jgi:hypothetical protein
LFGEGWERGGPRAHNIPAWGNAPGMFRHTAKG